MPFLLLASIQSAGSHLSNPMGLSSKIVPSFTENCRPHSRHFQMRRGLWEPGLPASLGGDVGPLLPGTHGMKGGGGIWARVEHRLAWGAIAGGLGLWLSVGNL